jgi:hypothetical protein
MGICGSSISEADKLEMRKSKEIEQANEDQHRVEQEKVKLLLLGAGESGKSTIFKQMKILYGVALSDEEKQHATPIVYNNVICAMKILCENCVELGLKNEVQCQTEFAEFMDVSDEAEIDPIIGGKIEKLWLDPGIIATWGRRSEYQIIESVQFYFKDISRIMKDDYLCNQQDLLYARVRTSGIVEEKYAIDGAQFVMYDVGGQRNERKKMDTLF